MAREAGDTQITSKNKVVGKQQLYALLVDAAGDPVLDAGGNAQVVEIGAESDGKLKINTSGLATEETLASLLATADINLTDLRDAIRGSGENVKTLFDLYTLLNSEPSVQLSGSNVAAKEIVTVADVAVELTLATYGTATKAMLQVQDAPIRYWQSGDAPTSTEGVLAQIGDVIYLDSTEDIVHFKAIRTTTTSANLACQYSS